jgi:hypothetical protein
MDSPVQSGGMTDGKTDRTEFNQEVSQPHWAAEIINDPYEFVDLEAEGKYKWVHLVSYKVAWYLSVAYQNSVWLSVAAVLVGVQALGIFKLRAMRPFLALVAVIGFGVDLWLVKSGWLINYQNEFPYWLILLWLQFVLLLPILKTWLKSYTLAFMVGAVSGPLAYYAGQTLGVIEVTEVSLLVHALLYGAILGSYIYTCPKLAQER